MYQPYIYSRLLDPVQVPCQLHHRAAKVHNEVPRVLVAQHGNLNPNLFPFTAQQCSTIVFPVELGMLVKTWGKFECSSLCQEKVNLVMIPRILVSLGCPGMILTRQSILLMSVKVMILHQKNRYLNNRSLQYIQTNSITASNIPQWRHPLVTNM